MENLIGIVAIIIISLFLFSWAAKKIGKLTTTAFAAVAALGAISQIFPGIFS